jgi:(E)-4-hydroxy-3-methylbut-2-enyl-diphosphate synthase
MTERFGHDDVGAMVASALEHCALLDDLGFTRYVVSMKDSDWRKSRRGQTPLRRRAPGRPVAPRRHRGRHAARRHHQDPHRLRAAHRPGHRRHHPRLAHRPFDDKGLEIAAGREIIADIAAGTLPLRAPRFGEGLNIISCPSCSRVENEAFIDLARNVKEMSAYASDYQITIAVMGCRVNGPGETDDADLGLWCGPAAVNLKRGSESLARFGYDAVLGRLRTELDTLIEAKKAALTP